MKIRLPWKNRKTTLEMDLDSLERKLAAALRPVEPDEHFVQALRVKVAGKSKKKLFGLQPQHVQNGLLVAGGLLSFSLMILAGLRMILTILGALGLIQLKKKMDEPVAVPSRPAQ